MAKAPNELDALQAAYLAAVDSWVAAIRDEKALASVAHNVAEIDKWEGAAFREDSLRDEVRVAKRAYEDALRKAHFRF